MAYFQSCAEDKLIYHSFNSACGLSAKKVSFAIMPIHCSQRILAKKGFIQLFVYFCPIQKPIIMRILLFPVVAILLTWSFHSCKSSSVPSNFCDTCLKDSLNFVGDHPLKPYVRIGAKECRPDTIAWNYEEYGTERKSLFEELIGMPVSINPSHFKCLIKDTSYAWLVFSDCYSGRGIQVRLPLTSSGKLNIRRSGINNYDPKFSITDGLIAYSDRGNIFVEELATDKKAMMTFGRQVDIDYDAIHEKLDSVNITPSRIWVRVKIGEEWKELEKNIELK
jgi:hypothetical protein